MLAFLAVMHLVLIGCNGIKSPTTAPVKKNPIEIETINGVGEDPDIPQSIISTDAIAYEDGAAERIDGVLGSSLIQKQIEDLGDYSFDSLSSFQINGSAVIEGATDTTQVEIVVLALENVDAPLDAAVFLARIEFVGIGWYVERMDMSFVEPNEIGYELLDSDAGVWYKTYAPVYGSKTIKHSLAAINWDWGGWWKCTMNLFTKGCAMMVTRCIVTGAGYVECVVVGCSAAFIGAMIGCAIEQL